MRLLFLTTFLLVSEALVVQNQGRDPTRIEWQDWQEWSKCNSGSQKRTRICGKAISREISANAYCKNKSSNEFGSIKNKETRACSKEILRGGKNTEYSGSSNTGVDGYRVSNASYEVFIANNMNKLSSYKCYHNPGTPDNYYRGIVRRIGGILAIKGSHPHIAKLSYAGFGKDGHFCDGSIIHKRFILTAAHCFVGWDEDASNYEVLVGAQESSTRTNDDKKAYSVKSIECHEEYKITERQVVNDICILKTNKDIEFNINVWPICLPDDLPPPNSEEHAGGHCYIGDWADSRFYSTTAAPTLSPELCQESYNEYSLFVDADQHVCAGNEKEDQNTCQGKSGGPLICDRNDLQNTLHHMAMNKNQKVLTGIQSFGVGCGKPRVYTNIHQFLPWIFEKLNKHDDCKPENPCKNGGICNSQDFRGHECECPAGWITEDCSLREKDLTACYRNSCISGKCILDDRYSRGYTCDCDFGYDGPFCNILTDECAMINCFMGSCELDSNFSAQCKCSSGWTGWHCSLKIAP